MEQENKQLAVYEDYRAKVNGFKNINASLVFDYESKKGNKDARSHIAKMKKVKTAINRVRIDEAKKYQVDLNAESALLTADVEEMILVHQKPLNEFEQREQIRIDAIEFRINSIFQRDAGTTSEEIQKEIDYVNSIDLDDGWDEFLAKAITSVSERLKFLHERMTARVQYEADQAELARLRQAEADRLAKEKADEDAKEDAGINVIKGSDLVKNNNGSFSHKPALKIMDDIAIDLGVEDLSVTADLSITPDGNKTLSNVKKVLSTKEKRLQSEEDLEALGFDKKQIRALFTSISFGKVRWIKFDLYFSVN